MGAHSDPDPQRRLGFRLSSRLPGARVEAVWRHATSWQGVNRELMPIVRMTHPARFPGVEDVPADGRCHMTSWLLLAGFLPIDAHRLAFRAMEAPRFFDECSSNLLMRQWLHRRELSVEDGAVVVSDEIGIVPRVPALGGVLLWIYERVFRHRHRRLRRRFDGSAEGS